jgi:hypothetical protein
LPPQTQKGRFANFWKQFYKVRQLYGTRSSEIARDQQEKIQKYCRFNILPRIESGWADALIFENPNRYFWNPDRYFLEPTTA